MEIINVVIRPCTQPLSDPSWKFARAKIPELPGYVLELTDDVGTVGFGYVNAIPAISIHEAGALASLNWIAPVLKGRRVDDIAGIMEELDAILAFNSTVKACVDMALHDLLARRLGVSVGVLLGGSMRTSIAQSRILALKPPAEMGAKAAELVEQGYKQLKLKLSGQTDLDVARLASVRDAVGPAITLTLDPNQSYNSKQMMRAFAQMERFDIALIEQPVPAADWRGLALLTKTLPVAIEADESAQTVHDVFRLVSERTVDVINLKVTKMGGLRRFIEAARICEAGGVVCRLGAAFGPSLLQSVGAHAASVLKTLPYACELSEHQHLLQDPFTELPVIDGNIMVPAGPGCGITYAA
ncbi:MAG TPA: enolase C-terminal domain-like protein [Eoetvoesiella sp.]